MNFAEYSSKNLRNPFIRLIRRIYMFTIKYGSNERQVQYLRDMGASIGKGVRITHIGLLGSEPYLVTIGDDVYFSGGKNSSSQILTHDGAIMQLKKMGYLSREMDRFGRVRIGKNCFIGANVIINRGVSIGDNCIIGAGSIVTKDIPDNSVSCGVPAKVIESVDEFYNKNAPYLEVTFFMSSYEKRKYIIEHNIGDQL
ncbi:Hexapeptide repeat of succinyl-transferase [Kandleria vitulina]|uniref:Hexapeptide repeat of succinyl-transferase n=1 Tax=Kandleria vitulina TaxID=1630 RepID=A0A1H2VNE6_9FIRM|nr:acyltransferase [Kandleria vitulina]SDW69826.1 Hexapeptide repeat of succinyl-transferase [Kandleria vitulina]